MKFTKTVRASKNVRPARPVRASRATFQKRAVKADDEIVEEPIEDLPAPAEVDVDVDIADDEVEVTVDDEATELLFEAEDVAELVSEVTGLPVDVTVDEDEVVFAVGDDEYTVTPEGDEEIVEQSSRVRKSAKTVKADSKVAPRRPAPARRVAASRRPAPARKVSAARRVAAPRKTQK
ncbi:MAG: hypothetical protein J5725_05780 [Bacteroidales bacterium]|nr:hypothetical protein [Bacteroidales bacterium]